jgi:hypothetical protein
MKAKGRSTSIDYYYNATQRQPGIAKYPFTCGKRVSPTGCRAQPRTASTVCSRRTLKQSPPIARIPQVESYLLWCHTECSGGGKKGGGNSDLHGGHTYRLVDEWKMALLVVFGSRPQTSTRRKIARVKWCQSGRKENNLRWFLFDARVTAPCLTES